MAKSFTMILSFHVCPIDDYKASFEHYCITLRDWSLITGRGGGYITGGGPCKVLSLRKGMGGGKLLEVSAILKVGRTFFFTLKKKKGGGARKVLPYLEVGWGSSP